MNDTKEIIKVLIADDQVLFSENLKIMLETLTRDIRITGIALCGKDAIDEVGKSRPDIILMDVRMPNIDGVEATKIIKSRWPEIKIVMLTTFLDDDYVENALEYGATGYLLKNIKPQDLIESIRMVNANNTILLSSQLIKKVFPPDKTSRYAQNPVFAQLGKKELEVLYYIGKGYSNKKIAEKMFISEPTVRNYVSKIYAKIGSNDRLEIISKIKATQEV